MTDNPSAPEDMDTPPAVERYFAENPDILAVELTDENTLPRRPR